MPLVRLALRFAPARVLAWLDRRRAPLGERVAAVPCRQGRREDAACAVPPVAHLDQRSPYMR